MKEMMTRKGAEAWFRAITLTERLPLLRVPSHTPQSVEAAKQKLQQWKEQAPFNKDVIYFEQRLTNDGLNEEELVLLLAGAGTTGAGLRDGSWMTKLQHLAEQRE